MRWQDQPQLPIDPTPTRPINYNDDAPSPHEPAGARLPFKPERYTDDMLQLRRHVDRLTLACQAMWELIRDRGLATEAELEEKVLEVDLRDGKADGRIASQVITCPSCGSNTNSRRTQCVMCGAPLKKEHLFEG